jgi:hypothetical protein
MSYVSWSGSDRFGPDRFGTDRFGSGRFGSDRFGSDRFSVILVIIGKSPYPGNIPSIPDYPKYRIIIACTVTVQLPMRVLHGMCHGRAPSGNDQLPTVVLYN